MAHARVSTYEFPPDRIEEARGQFENAAEPLRQMEGVTEILLLVDPSSGKAITITFWESEDALRASEQGADEVRQRAVTAGGGEITSIERYEIALRETF